MVMNMKYSKIASLFFWGIFSGVIIVGIGLGAAIPALNYIAGPFVCPGGHMTNTSQGYTVSPVESVTTVSLYCVDATGNSTEVGMFPTVLYSGVIYGLIIFVVIFGIQAVSASRRGAGGDTGFTDSALANRVRARSFASEVSADDPKARLEKLKEMHSSGLITQSEYDQKRKEILAEM